MFNIILRTDLPIVSFWPCSIIHMLICLVTKLTTEGLDRVHVWLYLQSELREKSWECEPERIVKVLQVNSSLSRERLSAYVKTVTESMLVRTGQKSTGQSSHPWMCLGCTIPSVL